MGNHAWGWVIATHDWAGVPAVNQPRLHGNRRVGRSTGVQVHRCAGAILDMTESTCMPQPLQVVFPQRPQRAGLHMCCSSWLGLKYWSTVKLYYTPMGIT